eukprot:CAMPEP_0185704334 /NCGR_PEP_ID=MMETSP1164-20130828/16809_1 /TAXON_ID=1104430 /ORGANISM="Chrysoreinhardia sp, Strain CCMP2950" /LENGTH=43 /DNA_ID= /DNA_START= /DNA_END= /DNA_ORIENTATION=
MSGPVRETKPRTTWGRSDGGPSTTSDGVPAAGSPSPIAARPRK